MKIRFKSPLRPSRNWAVPTLKAMADLFSSCSWYQRHSLPQHPWPFLISRRLMSNSSSWRKSACPACRRTCNSLTSHYQSALSLRFLPHAGVGRQAWTWKSFTPVKFPICLHPFYTCRHRRPTLWPCFAALLSGLGMSQAWYAWRGAVLPIWGGWSPAVVVYFARRERFCWFKANRWVSKVSDFIFSSCLWNQRSLQHHGKGTTSVFLDDPLNMERLKVPKITLHSARKTTLQWGVNLSNTSKRID